MNKDQNLKATLSFLFLVIVILCLLITLNRSPSFYIDEYWIASLAASSFGADNIINTSFRNYSPEYIDVQPLYILPLGGIIKLFGHSIFIVRLLSALSVLGCTFFMVKLSYQREWYSGVFLLFISFILLQPFVWRTAHICRPEPVVLFTILVALYVNTDFKNSRFIYNLFAGLALALPLYVYVTGALIIPLVGCLFLHEFFKDTSSKSILKIGAIRIVGFSIGITLFFLWVGTPSEVWIYFTKSEISKVTVSNAGFLSRCFSFLKYYGNYQLENLYLYLPAWVLIFYSFYIKGLKGKQFVFFIFYGIAVAFLTILSRKTVNYLIYSEIFFVMLLVSSLSELKPLIQKVYLTYLISVGIIFCIFYSVYFSGFDPNGVGIQFDRSIGDTNAVIIARVPYKYFFFRNDKFLALEEFEYLTRTNDEVSVENYIQSNSVEWAILDNASYEKKELSPIVKYIQDNFEFVHKFQDNFIGHRIYDDIPYEWNFKNILYKLKLRPSSVISIYRRKKKLAGMVNIE